MKLARSEARKRMASAISAGWAIRPSGCPLDPVDGAGRVYDPIVRGEAGEDVFGVFLKDYAPCAW